MGKYTSLIPQIPVYIELGQSNMDGRGYYLPNPDGQNGTLPAKYNIAGTDSNMKIYWGTTWDTSPTGEWQDFNIYTNNANPDKLATADVFGSTCAFLKEIADYKSQQVAVIKAAEGGTSLAVDWASGRTTYLTAKAWIENALDLVCQLGRPVVKCVTWLQGFKDCSNAIWASNYESNLEDLITRVNSVINGYVGNFNGRWVIHESPDWTEQYATHSDANQQAVRAAQRAVGTSGSNLFIDNTNAIVWSGDDVHYTGPVSYTHLRAHET